MFIGHSVSDGAGNLLTMDVDTRDFLQRSARDIVGLNYADLTHPDDVVGNVRRVVALDVDATPATIRKRYVLPGGSSVLADVRVSRLYDGPDGERLIGTIFSVDPAQRASEAAMLRSAAQNAIASLDRRSATFGKSMFGDPAWRILLELYLAESEGRLLYRDELADRITETSGFVWRWLVSFENSGLIEQMIDARFAIQLTARAFVDIERQLIERVEALATVQPG